MKQDANAYPYDEYPSYKGGHTVLYGRYVWEFFPNHRLRNMWGWVAQHRVVAEDMIGRDLVQSKDPRKQEVVHHRDENPTNNDQSNLQVMTTSDHRRLHLKKRHDDYVKHHLPNRDDVKEALTRMTIKATAEHFGIVHQTLRNHYPDLLAPYKRKSPVRVHSPTEEERKIVIDCAKSPLVSLRDCSKAAKMSTRTVRRLCKALGVEWVKKSKAGELKRTYRGEPTPRYKELYGSPTELEK